MGVKGEAPIKFCWHCQMVLPAAKHICNYCHTSQHSHSNAVHRQNLKLCADGKHCFLGGRCFHCTLPDPKVTT